MESAGLVASGFGDGLLLRHSILQSFAEAWERIWFLSAAASPELLGRTVTSSNGFACGPDRETAKSNAVAELVERAVVLRAWEGRRGWAPVPLTGVLTRILAARLSHSGWGLKFFVLREPRLGDVVCGLAQSESGGAIFDSSYRSPSVEMSATQSKVARSIVRAFLVSKQESRLTGTLPERAKPEAHAAFYRKPEHMDAFAFLGESIDKAPILLGHYDLIESRVVFDGEGLPAVAAARNEAWPQLRWGNRSITPGTNPWPHPIA